VKAKLAAWKRDPVLFITEVLRDPETGKPFELYPAQVEFLRRALTLTSDGRLPHPEMIFSGPKKLGKTATAAMAAIYAAVAIGGPFADVLFGERLRASRLTRLPGGRANGRGLAGGA
jgi:hypothetical protein